MSTCNQWEILFVTGSMEQIEILLEKIPNLPISSQQILQQI